MSNRVVSRSTLIAAAAKKRATTQKHSCSSNIVTAAVAKLTKSVQLQSDQPKHNNRSFVTFAQYHTTSTLITCPLDQFNMISAEPRKISLKRNSRELSTENNRNTCRNSSNNHIQVFKRKYSSPSTGSSQQKTSKFAPESHSPTEAETLSPHADRETPLTETVRYFLEPAELYSALCEKGIDFYTGVPDSLLKDFCAYVSDNTAPHKHIIACNEGSAIGIAAGYHLSSRQFPCVYMQNSGFGNAINPLLSLCDPKVYSIPMLLLIGWRGEPGKKDEPQHIVQGKVMSSLLTDLNIQFEVLPDYIEGAKEAIETAHHYMSTRKSPYALLVKRQTFTSYKMKNHDQNKYTHTREEAIEMVLNSIKKYDVTVSTTGFTSRELYELRDKRKEGHGNDFLTVGSMGHSSSIALGIAISKPSRNIFCLDGDGALLMHMGSIGTIGTMDKSLVKNYKHILINNGCHDSVGGQKTKGFDIDFTAIAHAAGYSYTASVSGKSDIEREVDQIQKMDGPCFIEIRVNKGARKNLGRPKTTPIVNKNDFMKQLES